MNALLAAWSLLAEEAPPAGGAGPGGGFGMMLLTFGPILLVFYFLMIRPQRQEQSRRQKMLDGLKKNDRVVTAGGIYGVVINVHREADEVTLKVDESTNTKLRVTLSSVTRVLGDEASTPETSKS